MLLSLFWQWCRDYKQSVPCYRSPSKEQAGAKYGGRHCIMGVGRLIGWAKNVGLSPLGSRKGWFINCNTITTPQAWGGAPAGNSFHSGPPAGASLLSDSLLGQQRRQEAGPAPTPSQACLLQLFNAPNTPREPHHQLPGVKRMPEEATCFKSYQHCHLERK